MQVKKAAIPEYIWYVALIAITLGLVVIINTITSKSTKQVTETGKVVPFTVEPFRMSGVPGKSDEVQIDEAVILPKTGFKPEDLNALYIMCKKDSQHYAKLVCLYERMHNKSIDPLKCNVEDPVGEMIFVSEGGQTYNLRDPIIINNETLPGLNPECYKQGTEWELWYSDPKRKGKRIYVVTVS
jgi:hypothetical protein